MKLQFWGVRGSIPTPGRDYLEVGGNTACVEVRLPDGTLIVLDAGTGLRELGKTLSEEGRKEGVNLFLSHLHWDHIQGIPFFEPLYRAGTNVRFFARIENLQEILERQMASPYFPVPLETAPSRREYVELGLSPVRVGAARITPFPLNHPQGATGFRLECEGRSVVYASDLEHGDPELDAILSRFSLDADLLIYDAQYTPHEYEKFQGWGHSTWRQATEVARRSGVKKLILFHHDPAHTDARCDTILREAREHFPGTELAREGLSLDL